MTQSTLYDPGIPITVKATKPVRFQVQCRVCGWKGLYCECEKDEGRRYHCPNCHHAKLLDRDEKENDFVREDSQKVAQLRRRWLSQEPEFIEGKATLSKALVEMGVRR